MAQEAVKEKELGNAAYKQKDFAEALTHYDRAIELDPKNIVFYLNKTAVLFEDKKYEECIELCLKAVDIGREERADYTHIAKALTRIGNSYLKMEKIKEAITYFEKSLSEYRDPELVKKTKALEKQIAEQERLAYIDPQLANVEKIKGNQLFKQGKYPEAMKHYNEAVKRDPENAVLYSNRAACFTKLMDFQRVLDDCDTCIKKDPNFIKAYIRKGAALIALKEFSRAQSAYEAALEIDSGNQEARQGLLTSISGNNEDPDAVRERAMRDPEVMEILKDPGMRLLLEQMSNEPGAVREHLQNPDIMKKLTKLREAGIIKLR